MSKFSRAMPKPQTVEEFIGRAGQPTSIDTSINTGINTSTNTDTNISTAERTGTVLLNLKETADQQAKKSKKPWEAHRKKATAKNLFNLRLNDYYMEILRHLASINEDISMQRIVKEILCPELERRAGVESDH